MFMYQTPLQKELINDIQEFLHQKYSDRNYRLLRHNHAFAGCFDICLDDPSQVFRILIRPLEESGPFLR